jgi:hypothetical protein
VHSHAPSQGSKATEPNVPSKDENHTPAAQDSTKNDRPADENSMTTNEDLKKKEEIPNRNRTVTRDPVTPPIEAERRSDRGTSSHRGNADNASDDEEFEDEERLGPKLIQWSGSVNGAREITVEMPGLPGRIEIPRVYRDRVGIIEPPSADNRWRCAIMRVFGRGHISFIMRWWPMAANRRYTARSR